MRHIMRARQFSFSEGSRNARLFTRSARYGTLSTPFIANRFNHIALLRDRVSINNFQIKL